MYTILDNHVPRGIIPNIVNLKLHELYLYYKLVSALSLRQHVTLEGPTRAMTPASGSVLVVEGVTFRHVSGGRPEVDDVSFTLCAGQTFGVLGGNECGKTTLAQVLLGNLVPESGTVTLLGAVAAGAGPRLPRWLTIVRLLFAICAVFAALLAAFDRHQLASATTAGAWSVPLALVLLEVQWHIYHRFATGVLFAASGSTDSGMAPPHQLQRGVAYISSEHDAGQKLGAGQTIEEAISAHMPASLSKAEKRAEVRAALEASGFQIYTESGRPVGDPEQYLHDGLKCGELSGGQRHLVYVLSILASRPRLLICDELLCGLDIDRQSSMLTLLQKLQLKFGMALLWMTVDLTSFTIMANDRAAFMKHGRFLEVAHAHDLVQRPQRKDTQVCRIGASAWSRLASPSPWPGMASA